MTPRVAIFDSKDWPDFGPIIVPDEETAILHASQVAREVGYAPIAQDLPGPGGGRVLQWLAVEDEVQYAEQLFGRRAKGPTENRYLWMHPIMDTEDTE